ncbi:MAG: AAA family ATPase [Gammaproteobacteria bacterium RIFCSPHIGHO2_02_FULL_39_13]|nr:MAG: AAA family ATPase [Gammaproteobacteria bacterium RIFCSPHIGHO2_02_FULL_39_13]OGT50512.1 MAG: AAA family ATPase [Gammaproteobacteria bacterium RIFCSPHIGHO2_12_FULL_39_24]
MQEWITDPQRKPLVLRGARQTGKTWLARQLAKTAGKTLIEINFEAHPEFRSLFDTNEPAKIVRNIEFKLDSKIELRNSLLLLDEVQMFPEVLAKLRWFYELLPELPVIAAGSLLDFALADHSFSMSVGRIDYLHLEPLSFEEFLLAKGLDQSVAFLQEYSLPEKIPDAIHQKLLSVFREYVVIGGMPAAVSSWIETQSLENVSRIHNNLLLTYRDDFAKYAKRISIEHLEEILMAIPKMLGQKFVYSHVNPHTKTETLKKALDLLCKARICYKIQVTHANGLPLLAEVNKKYYKVGLVDTGLASSLLGLRLGHLESVYDLNLVNEGAISEQVIAQLLRCIEPDYVEPHHFYWCRAEKNSNAEIDFVMQHHHDIIPIEVKSGKTGSLKSLQQFMYLKKRKRAVRINADIPNTMSVDLKTPAGASVVYQLLSIPFYLTEELHRLLDE